MTNFKYFSQIIYINNALINKNYPSIYKISCVLQFSQLLDDSFTTCSHKLNM